MDLSINYRADGVTVLYSDQALMQEALEWRQVAETNGNLMRRFEESRADLEKALRVGQACLKERGDPDELFRKHNVRQ